MEVALKAIEVMGTIDAEGQLQLDEPLALAGPGRVRVILLFSDQAMNEQEWLQAASKNPAFDFLHDPQEDIYTVADGRPFRDEG